ncbi:MAG: hypothetical protein H0U35_12405 [Sporichthyaceae bacterium]|nr:hypothetical protein [Sporichthyaceae bacterium]
MVSPPAAARLTGRVVRLDPVVPDDAEELFAALDDQRVWAAGYGGAPRPPPEPWWGRAVSVTGT